MIIGVEEKRRLSGRVNAFTLDIPTPIQFKDFFGNANPIELEIGCGKGKLFVERAEQNPEINFLGIDIAGKWMRKGQKKVFERELQNLQFLKAEAHYFLRDCVFEGSLDIIHVNFPDPWPKARHHKRRFVNTRFFQLAHQVLKEGGLLEIATDHTEYYEFMKEALVESKTQWQSQKENMNQRIFDSSLRTSYEVKFESIGKDLHYLELKK